MIEQLPVVVALLVATRRRSTAPEAPPVRFENMIDPSEFTRFVFAMLSIFAVTTAFPDVMVVVPLVVSVDVATLEVAVVSIVNS